MYGYNIFRMIFLPTYLGYRYGFGDSSQFKGFLLNFVIGKLEIFIGSLWLGRLLEDFYFIWG
jgi:hypothetical protein